MSETGKGQFWCKGKFSYMKWNIICYNKGYTKSCIGVAINKASLISREDVLVDKTIDNRLTQVPFVVVFNLKLPSLPKIPKDYNLYCTHQDVVPLSSQKCLSSATEGQGTLAICYVADIEIGESWFWCKPAA